MHSTTTSMSGSRVIDCQSSVIQVLRVFNASSTECACARAGFQPTRARFARAATGERSAIATRCTPGVRGICARYIEPNFPAPIKPMRIGRPSASRRCSWA